MISSYVGENAEFERQYLSGELEVELTPQVIIFFFSVFKTIKPCKLLEHFKSSITNFLLGTLPSKEIICTHLKKINVYNFFQYYYYYIIKTNSKGDENENNILTRGYCLMSHQILITNIQGNVWQAERRISSLILGLKPNLYQDQAYSYFGFTKISV